MSYLKGPERRDGLPTIRNSGIFDNNFASTTSLRNGHAFTTLDDSAIHERGHDRSFRRVRGQSPPATSHIRSSSPSQVRRSTYEVGTIWFLYWIHCINHCKHCTLLASLSYCTTEASSAFLCCGHLGCVVE